MWDSQISEVLHNPGLLPSVLKASQPFEPNASRGWFVPVKTKTSNISPPHAAHVLAHIHRVTSSTIKDNSSCCPRCELTHCAEEHLAEHEAAMKDAAPSGGPQGNHKSPLHPPAPQWVLFLVTHSFAPVLNSPLSDDSGQNNLERDDTNRWLQCLWVPCGVLIIIAHHSWLLMQRNLTRKPRGG